MSPKRPRVPRGHCTLKPSKPSPKVLFAWNEKDWAIKKQITRDVDVMVNRTTSTVLVVRKLLKRTVDDNGRYRTHVEARFLQKIPRCNVIVNLLLYRDRAPDIYHGTAFFLYYERGDVFHWKRVSFDEKNGKMVPEAYIWRFFIQMSQALAYIQGEIGPNQECFLHRDIKPGNILVVDNGTTYPSFKLHDFGCGTFWSPEKALTDSMCGTFEWQAPENPRINTTAAEIWSLGACVHFLALNKAPIQSTEEYERQVLERLGRNPHQLAEYSGAGRYWAARVPREVTPINLCPAQQISRNLLAHSTGPREGRYNPQYSDKLNTWMLSTLKMMPRARTTAKVLVEVMVPQARRMLKKLTGGPGLVQLEVKWEDW